MQILKAICDGVGCSLGGGGGGGGGAGNKARLVGFGTADIYIQ